MTRLYRQDFYPLLRGFLPVLHWGSASIGSLPFVQELRGLPQNAYLQCLPYLAGSKE